MVPSCESEGGIHSLALRARIQVDAVIVCNPSVRRSRSVFGVLAFGVRYSLKERAGAALVFTESLFQ